MAERCSQVAFDCPYAGKKSCIITRHHLLWPASAYETELEQAYRNKPEHIALERRCDHDYIHETQFPPAKPSVEEMIVALTVRFEEAAGYEQAA